MPRPGAAATRTANNSRAASSAVGAGGGDSSAAAGAAGGGCGAGAASADRGSRRPTALAMGIRVSATARLTSSEKVTVSAGSTKSCPAMPLTNTTGMNTHSVVRVAATTAPPTSAPPARAAVARSAAALRWRSMLSSTTMELSTSMPMPSASPPSDMMLSDTPPTNMRKKLAITEMGIANPTTRVLRRRRRNRYSTAIASAPPSTAAWITSRIDCSMKRDWSATTRNSTSTTPTSSCSISPSRVRTAWATATVLAAASLWMAISTLGGGWCG